MISWVLFKKTLKQNRQPLFWYAFIFLAYSWMIVAIFPSLDKTMAYDQILNEMPKEMLAFLGSTPGDFAFTFETYIGMEYLSFMYPLILGGFIVAFVTRFFTKEIESGVIANVLAQPISRVRIFFSKFWAFLISLAILVLVSIPTMPIMSSWYDFSLNWKGIWLLSFLALSFGLAYGGFCFLTSVFFSERGKALGINLGLLIGSYVLWGFGNMNDFLKDFQWLSIFQYWKPTEILTNNVIQAGDVWVLLGIFVVTIIPALVWFDRRDISI